MPKSKSQKEGLISDLVAMLSTAKSAVFVDATGLTVAASNALRQACKDAGCSVMSAKKTLLQKALSQNKIEDSTAKAWQGSLLVAASATDEVTPAKLVKDFAKKYNQLQFRAGVMDGKLIELEMVKQLANLPSKEELLAKLVGSLNAPISGFVNVLAGNLRGLVQVLNAIKNKS